MAQDRHIFIRMPELDKPGKPNWPSQAATLELHTYKMNRGLYSTATMGFVQPDGCTVVELFGDYRARVAYNVERGTQANIDKQHAASFTPEAIEHYKTMARAFYAGKAAKRALDDARESEAA